MENRGLMACLFLGGSVFYAWRAIHRYAQRKLAKRATERQQLQDWENEGGALRTAPQQPVNAT